MSIDAVIYTTIVQPNQNNFYLNPHTTYQGVNRPPHYHVLLNDIGLTTSELQLLTFHLCFTDPRLSSSTTVGDQRNWSRQNPSSNNLDYEVLQVHEKLNNLPVLG
ncbi:unnamed protein product [Rotaria sp. Silwood2]|nr:unnamed protein product [Rotaria sp. Silwood2]